MRKNCGCFPPEVSETTAWNLMVRPSPKWWSATTVWSDFTVPSPIPSTHLGIWACGSTWRRHTGKRGSAAPQQRIIQPTSWPHVASPTWSSTEQVARSATKRFHPSDWRPLEACCRPWTWWCNDATALAGYAKTSTTMMMATVFAEACATTVSADHRAEVPASDSALSLTMHALQIMILLYCVVFYKHWQRW